MLPAFVDEKDELDSYLLRLENARWGNLRGHCSRRAMDVYTRMSNEDANDYDMLKKALLTSYNFTEDGYRR